MSTKNSQIFVTRLPRNITQEDLRKHFRKFGSIREITLKRTFGFVEYEDYEDAREAIAQMHHTHIDGQKIVVEKAGERKNPKRKGPQEEDSCFICKERGHWWVKQGQ